MAFPDGAVAGGEFVVRPGDAAIYVPQILLPDRFTIRCDPRVTEIRWQTDLLEFGTDCTIDLTPQAGVPEPFPKPVTQGRRLRYGARGFTGITGKDGKDGQNGVAFQLVVQRIVQRGSLWIRADGLPGQNGGEGGNGGRGGTSSCGFPSLGGGKHTNGGNGGPGGTGGHGGRGGNTSKIVIYLGRGERHPVVPVANPGDLAPSQRPQSAIGNSGVLAIWGCPGPGGVGGAGGAGGAGGQRDRDCPWPTGDVHAGHRGGAGHAGGNGDTGKTTTVEIDPTGDLTELLASQGAESVRGRLAELERRRSIRAEDLEHADTRDD